VTGFDITHAAHLHPPYGLWIVRRDGVVIGRQLSKPDEDDCRRMLREHREGRQVLQHANVRISATSYHLSGAAATKRSQRLGGYRKRGKRHGRKA